MKRISLLFVFLSLLGCEQSANGVLQNVSSSVPVSKIRWISFVPFLNDESVANKRLVALSHKGVHIIHDGNKGTNDNGSIMYEKANITNENKLPYNQSRVVLIPSNYNSEKKIIVHTVTSELEDNGGFYITEISDVDLNKNVDELEEYSLDENTITKLISYDEAILKHNADEVKPSRVLVEVPTNANEAKKYAIGTLELATNNKVKFNPIATIDDFMKIESGKFTGIFKYENYSKWSISDPNTIRPAKFWSSPDASVVVFMDSCGLYYYAYRETTTNMYKVSEILTKNDREQIAKENQKKRQWLDSNSDSYRMLSFFLPNYKENGVKWIALSRYGYFYHSDCNDDFRTKDGRFSIDPTTPVVSLVCDEWENGEEEKKITLFARYIGYGYIVARIHTKLDDKNKLIQDSSDGIEYQSSGFAEKFRTSTITDIVHLDLKDTQKRHKLIIGTAKGGVGVYTISNINNEDDFSPKNVCDSSTGFKNESFNVIEVFN